MGFGAIIRDSKGIFMACRMGTRNELLPVREAEALALLDVLLGLSLLNLRILNSRWIPKIVVDVVHSSSMDLSKFGAIILSSRNIISNEAFFEFILSDDKQI